MSQTLFTHIWDTQMMRNALNADFQGRAGVSDKTGATPDRQGTTATPRDATPKACEPRSVKFEVRVRGGKVLIGRPVRKR